MRIASASAVARRLFMLRMIGFLCGLVVAGLLSTARGAGTSTFRDHPPLWQAWTMVQLTDYVSWPGESKPVNSDKFVIGIVGAAEVHRYLEVVLKQKGIDQIQRRPVEVVSIAVGEAGERVMSCDMVFVVAEAEKNVLPRLAACTAKGVITLGISPEFTKRGGVFRFDMKKGTLIYSRGNLEKAPYGLHRRIRRYFTVE